MKENLNSAAGLRFFDFSVLVVSCCYLVVDFRKMSELHSLISKNWFYKFVLMLDFIDWTSTVVEYYMKSSLHLFNLQGAQLLTAAKGLSNLKVTHRRHSNEYENQRLLSLWWNDLGKKEQIYMLISFKAW